MGYLLINERLAVLVGVTLNYGDRLHCKNYGMLIRRLKNDNLFG
jgi:hypothetical protein